MSIKLPQTSMQRLYQSAQPGLEAIEFQYNRIFHSELVEAVKKLFGSKGTEADIKKAKIEDVILKRLGIKTSFIISKDIIGAAVEVPGISQDNPLLNDWERGDWTYRDGANLLETVNLAERHYEVDLLNSKLGGVISKLVQKIYLGTELLDARYFTPNETAAIICHELGHVFVYYEMATRMLSTDYALQAVSDSFLGTNDIKRRVQICKDLEEALKIELEDKETICKGKSLATLQTLVVKQGFEKAQSDMGLRHYDERGYEAMADLFASRHGFTVELATGLDKIWKRYGNAMPAHPLLQLVLLPLVVLLIPHAFINFANIPDIYDTPEVRLDKLRNDLIAKLKDRKLADDLRELTLLEVAKLDELIKTNETHRAILKVMWEFLMPYGRKVKSSVKLQQNLEKLAHNDLYVAANKLKTELGA